MINEEYINDSINLEFDNIFNQYSSFTESCDKDINSMFSDFGVLHEKITLESTIMGSVPERMTMVYEDGKKNIFAKIGDMIISLFENIKKFIETIIDKFSDLTLRKKTDIQKLEVLLKKHPELKDETVGAFREGALDLSDIKNIKELDNALDEILKMSRAKADPDSIKTKWEKAKAKFEKDGVIVTAAKKTATVVSAASAVAMFIPNCAKAVSELKKLKAGRQDEMADALKMVKELENDNLADKSTSALHTFLQALRYRDNKITELIKDTSNAWTKMANGMASIITKIPKLGEHINDKAAKKQDQIKAVHDKKAEVKKESDKMASFEKGRMEQSGREYAKTKKTSD